MSDLKTPGPARRRLANDRAVADHEVAGVEARELPRRRALGDREQLDLRGEMAAGVERLGDAALESAAVGAHAHAVHVAAGAVQHEVAHRDALSAQLLARAHRDGVRGGVGAEHVHRGAGGDAEAVALAYRVEVRPGVLAEDPPVARADRAGPPAQAAMALEERLAAGPGEEAEILGGPAPGHREGRAPRELPDLRLVEGAEREAQACERRGRESRQHVALVLRDVDGGAQQRRGPVALDARVVPGRERARAEPRRELEHRVEPHAAVAAD